MPVQHLCDREMVREREGERDDTIPGRCTEFVIPVQERKRAWWAKSRCVRWEQARKSSSKALADGFAHRHLNTGPAVNGQVPSSPRTLWYKTERGTTEKQKILQGGKRNERLKERNRRLHRHNVPLGTCHTPPVLMSKTTSATVTLTFPYATKKIICILRVFFGRF